MFVRSSWCWPNLPRWRLKTHLRWENKRRIARCGVVEHVSYEVFPTDQEHFSSVVVVTPSTLGSRPVTNQNINMRHGLRMWVTPGQELGLVGCIYLFNVHVPSSWHDQPDPKIKKKGGGSLETWKTTGGRNFTDQSLRCRLATLAMAWAVLCLFCFVTSVVLLVHVRTTLGSFSEAKDFIRRWLEDPTDGRNKNLRVEEKMKEICCRKVSRLPSSMFVVWCFLVSKFLHFMHDFGGPYTQLESSHQEIQMVNYKLICKGMAHCILPTTIFALQEAMSMPQVSTVGVFLAVLCAYSHNLAVGTEMVDVTQKRMKVACYFIHIWTLLLSFFTSLGSTDVMSFCYNKPVTSTTRLILLGFLDKSVTIPFNLLHAALDIGTYFLVFQDDVWPSFSSIVLSEISFTLCSISASFVLEIWVKSRIEALLDTADAETLVSSFQRMLRGVCDGEVLLDHNYQISGDGQCLQHLIMTTMSMAGKSFDRLLADEERQSFTDFIQSSTDACEESRLNSCPVCLRVSLRGTAGTRVAVDLYLEIFL